MKYCCQYSNKIQLSIFDEISIIYNRQDEQLIAFLQEHKNQRIILIIKDIEDFLQAQEWKKLDAIKEKYQDFNFTVCFGALQSFSEASDALHQCISNLSLPFFTGYIATNFDQLHYLLNLGVSDVYIAEDICFNLQKVKQVCSTFNIQTRAFPNVAQSGVKATPPLKKFFIRPEDVEEYSDVIDVLEFWGPTGRQEILHKIYTKGVWFGDLEPLILDFNLSFDSRRIVPGFAQARKVCDRKCMKGHSCTICDSVYNISKQLEEKNLIIKNK